MAKVKMKKETSDDSRKKKKESAGTPVVKWEDDIKNPKNRLAVNEVRNNRYGAVDAKMPGIIGKIFPKKVTQEEYNKFWDVSKSPK